MSTYKEIESAASACRNAQLFVEEILKVLKPYEENAAIRTQTFGFVSATIDSLMLSRTNLQFCADRLYHALDRTEGSDEE